MESILISNYKSLEKLEISQLKRVNLFTGKNNTGKSTVLEALSLLISKGNPSWIYHLLDTRGEINNSHNSNISAEANLQALSTLFSHRNIGFENSNSIKVTSESNALSLRFVKFIEEDVVEKDTEGNRTTLGQKKLIVNDAINENYQLGLEIKSNHNTNIFRLERIFRILHRRNYHQIIKNKNFFLINSMGDNLLNSSALWDKITLSEKEDLVIDALKIIEPSITRLSFIGEGNDRYPIVKLKTSDKPHPLKAMGDGINRILNLILALVNSDGGYLMIDEFENGLHYSVQEKLWEVIFEISNKSNTQLFVTTHSNDSIHSFAKVLAKSEKYEGTLYRLTRSNNQVKANIFSEDEIKEASLQHINLR